MLKRVAAGHVTSHPLDHRSRFLKKSGRLLETPGLGIRLTERSSRDVLPYWFLVGVFASFLFFVERKMASGTYTEELPSGGKLTVTANGWSIDFQGPDLRYK